MAGFGLGGSAFGGSGNGGGRNGGGNGGRNGGGIACGSLAADLAVTGSGFHPSLASAITGAPFIGALDYAALDQLAQ